MMTRYDYKGVTDFLNNDVSLDELSDSIYGAIGLVQDIEDKHGESEASQEIFSTLLICADLIESIRVK